MKTWPINTISVVAVIIAIAAMDLLPNLPAVIVVSLTISISVQTAWILGSSRWIR